MKCEIPWEAITPFYRHRPGKTFLRESLVSDGHTWHRIDSLSFPEYDQIISLIQVARRSRRCRKPVEV